MSISEGPRVGERRAGWVWANHVPGASCRLGVNRAAASSLSGEAPVGNIAQELWTGRDEPHVALCAMNTGRSAWSAADRVCGWAWSVVASAALLRQQGLPRATGGRWATMSDAHGDRGLATRGLPSWVGRRATVMPTAKEQLASGTVAAAPAGGVASSVATPKATRERRRERGLPVRWPERRPTLVARAASSWTRKEQLRCSSETR